MTDKVDPKAKQPKPVELNDEELSGVAGGAKKKSPSPAPQQPPLL